MHIPDARKILSELKDVHGFVSVDDEKTLDLISKMVAGKPKIEANPRFLENLRSRLLLEASAPAASSWWKTWQSFAKFLSVPVALAGFAAIAGTLGLFDVAKPGTAPGVPEYPVAMTFIDSGDEKSAAESDPTPSVATPTATTMDDRTLESIDSGISNIVGNTAESTTGDVPMTDSMEFSTPMAANSPAGGNALKMGTPSNVAITEYRYSFAGEMPKLPKPLPTYERTPKLPLPAFVKAADSGMAVSQDVENGYSTIMRDYEKWPEKTCENESCRKPLEGSDVPTDAVIVGIATGFAQEMEISLSGYGNARVDSSWKNALAQTSDPSSKIIPDNLTVVFPRKVGWFEIWDDSGYPTGITFIVNHVTKRVQQVIGIESSTLSSPSSISSIEEAAVTVRLSNGGSSTAPATESGTTVVEIPMSRAKIGYTLQYAEKNGKWIEFYVPSIVFETDEVPKVWEYFRTRVIVPLADVTKG